MARTIRASRQIPSVAAAWRARHGRDFTEGDVDAIFQVFEPMNIAAVRDHADVIPGTIEAVEALRARGIRIAGTTGYTRPIMDVLEPLAAAAGYRPELTVCAGDLPAARPTPLMMWYAMARLGVWPAATVVKVDDTAPGIGEGRAAGTWTVGVALTGNAVGLSAEELAAVSQAQRGRLREQAAAELRDADMVIDSIADLPAGDRDDQRPTCRRRAARDPESLKCGTLSCPMRGSRAQRGPGAHLARDCFASHGQ